MLSSYTGVILAGGLNSRFSGTNKAFMQIRGKRILDHIYDVFSDLFEEIILVTNDPLKYLGWNLKIVTDIHPSRSSLTGLHAGLFYATGSHVFITACDTPFLRKDLVEALISAALPQTDIVIPETTSGREALCAVYSKRCLKQIENQLEKNDYKIQRFFNKVRVVNISEKKLRAIDPELISFFNVNTPLALEKAKEMEKK
ncbi:MAG: molybdenum cofactor guanylyltransferase [Desulfobacteraceae bacterium]|nr:MAG: molybdenum cofactor guanylyltransferase [Desulfobacteraceae bacterium]